jgi:tRNA threonylcarbamoyladenosine modification (KEOPS) complex Cgi121 subunit
MLSYFEEDGRYLRITGFKDVRFEDAEELIKAFRKDKQKDVTIQFFDGKLVATWEHLYFAVLNALMAFRTGRNISKNLAMEVMLYASAQRQIRKAIQLIGVKRGCYANIAAVVIGDNEAAVGAELTCISKRLDKKPDDGVLGLSKDKTQSILRAFGISPKELEVVMGKDNEEQALVKIVIERMALLSTQL